MAAKKSDETAAEPSAPAEIRRRSPIKAVVTFDVLDADGNNVGLPAGHRVVVRSVERDMLKFAEMVLDSPASVGLFAKIEVPFAA